MKSPQRSACERRHYSPTETAPGAGANPVVSLSPGGSLHHKKSKVEGLWLTV